MTAAHSSAGFAARVFWIKVVTVAAWILSWEALARSGLFYEGVVPRVVVVVRALAQEVLDFGFYHDLTVTLLEAIIGFIFGSSIAIALGIALGLRPFMRRMIEPFVMALGGTPKIIFLPILFLIFGLGIESKMAKAALSTFFPVVLSTTSGFIGIKPVLLNVGRSFHLNRRQMVTKVYVPAMIDPLLTGLRLGMAMAIIGVLSAEISYSDSGLGFRLIRNADRFNIASVYAITILIFMTAAAMNFAISKMQDRFNRDRRRSPKKQASDLSPTGPVASAAPP
jgi:ABC-type nitrate/sulfonate/bicarbonate transport system permease component